MFKRLGKQIDDINLRWNGNLILIQYFIPDRSLSEPERIVLRFADNYSTICFLNLLSAIISIDYKKLDSATDRRMTVLDMIADQTWTISEAPASRPMIIEFKVFSGHRMMFVKFRRGSEQPKNPLLIMDFLIRDDLILALRFLDDLLEENSSSARNSNIRDIEYALRESRDSTERIIYTLRDYNRTRF